MELMKNQKRVLDVIQDNAPIKRERIVELTCLPLHKVRVILSEFHRGDIISITSNGDISIKTKVEALRDTEDKENHWRNYKLKNLARIV